jgi:putative holliday junction resolvase
MRVLALDHGTRRIGVALSDELGMIARPLEFIEAEPFATFLNRLRHLVSINNVELVVVGMPRNMDGSYGPAAMKVREFVGVLRTSLTVPIELWDERLTSVQANQILSQAAIRGGKRKARVDAVAAAILLQSYLDHRVGG